MCRLPPGQPATEIQNKSHYRAKPQHAGKLFARKKRRLLTPHRNPTQRTPGLPLPSGQEKKPAGTGEPEAIHTNSTQGGHRTSTNARHLSVQTPRTPRPVGEPTWPGGHGQDYSPCNRRRWASMPADAGVIRSGYSFQETYTGWPRKTRG